MKKLSLITVCLLTIAGCGHKEKTTTDNTIIGRYLFIGDNYIIHKVETCHALRYGRDDNGHRTYGKTYVDTTEFISDEGLSYCTHCINKADYERIKLIIERNKQ